MSTTTYIASVQWEWQEELRNGTHTVPDFLYHYTSGQGLYGIASTGSMWGTNHSFMNDRSEFEYGLGLLKDTINSRLTVTRAPEVRLVLEAALHFLASGHDDLYLTCFCEAADLLSQWRGYGSQDSRYCLQFATRPLNALTEPGFSVQPVIYQADEQSALLDRCLDIHINAMSASQGINLYDLDPLARCVVGCALDVVTRFKDSAFAEEREWRCVLPYTSFDHTDVQFAPAGGGMRPYRILVRAPDGQNLPITKVIAGASHSERQSLKSARMILDRFGYNSVEVSSSRVPLRA